MKMSDTTLIIEKIDSLRELTELKFENSDKQHQETNAHLEKLNGQTARNTQFRIKGSVYFKGLYIITTAILIPTIYLVIDKLWK